MNEPAFGFFNDDELAQMDQAALEKYVAELDADMALIREAKRSAARFLEKRVAADAAQRKIAAMSDTERAALTQALIPSGIESAEAVNKA